MLGVEKSSKWLPLRFLKKLEEWEGQIESILKMGEKICPKCPHIAYGPAENHVYHVYLSTYFQV